MPASRAERAERRALWILLAAGLALLLAASVASGDQPTVTRTDRFDATLAPGTVVRVENVNGDLVAAPGRAFSATVTITVAAATKSRAQEILDRTRIESGNEDGAYRLETIWPGRSGSRARDRHRSGFDCHDCRIVARYALVLPAGISARLQTVNGEVRVSDLDGDVEAHSVNGSVIVSGARRSLRAQTVNGRVEAAAQAMPAGVSWALETVNGSVLATLPKDAGFRWSATTMSGSIASTFALSPAREEMLAPEPIAAPVPRPRPAPAPPAARVRSADEDEDGNLVVDTEEIERQVEESLRQVEVVIRENDKAMHEHEKTMRQMRVVLPHLNYEATVGAGGASLRTTTLNGSITLLAAGTREADAKPLASGRRSIVVTVPRVEVHAPEVHVRVPPVHVEVPAPVVVMPAPEAPDVGEIVRGDIAGDFLSTSNGSYRVGHVSGRVKILTNSGEIHLASAGKGADLKTFGGDIQLGPILGDLKAQTSAGDVRVGPVTGSATVSTSGGDIRIERVSGLVVARTAGGDVILPAVGGAVQAQTAGGEVRIGIVARMPKGVVIRNDGGDVVLTLPSDAQADLDLRVEGPADPEEVLIRSDFPGIAISRGEESQRAVGALNGGGARITVRTSSGSIRIRKGPAAGS
jgi:DUF4097 and DUF4098 domain-containing protein YvlB